ncbi:MAG: hypothetical protein LBU39_02755 [Desulfobulbaceae bacterium]|jgi:3-deoxy-D-manno-octulosonic-acid transferase|nr:hypothetical protein [Desulfobulbaceae bacterium]
MKLYKLCIGCLACALLPPLLLFSLVSGWQRRGLRERLGLYPRLLATRAGRPRIWLHAASVGEARAAAALVAALRRIAPDCAISFTALTARGRDVARGILPSDISCFLAPLDIPGIVHLAIKRLNPDLYVSIESELWPLTLACLNKNNCPAMLANGRMTAKAAASWRRFAWQFRDMFVSLRLVAAIGQEDRDRFAALGVATERLVVCGNVKRDHILTDEDHDKLRSFRDMFALSDGVEVFVAGSTHPGEDAIIIEVWRRLAAVQPIMLLLAPRHLDRLPTLCAMLREMTLPFQTLSAVSGGVARRESVLLVDSYGDLPVLYGLADYIFCGGSLSANGGHNPLEAALWRRAVCHGLNVCDFAEIYRKLDEAAAAFPVRDGEELLARIASFRDRPNEYRLACRRAEEIAMADSGAANRQAKLALRMFRTG